MSAEHDGGTVAVVTALAANVGIALSKFVGFAVTGSSSMASEAVHSVVDCGNQILLLIGAKASERAPDERHQFGYGPEKFFWSFLVSVMLFVLGAGFAAKEGIDKVLHPKALEHLPVAVVILGVAVLLEGFSFRTVIKESNKVRGHQSLKTFVRSTKNPDLALVLLEDAAALTGLTLALVGIGLYYVTGSAVFDGIASLMIAVLLGAVALIMGTEMKSLLIGEAASPDDAARIAEAILSVAGIDRIIHMRTQHLGPSELLVAVKVASGGRTSVARIAGVVDEAERRVRAIVPSARYIFIETDVDRAEPETDHRLQA
jgi:cation diffusion facilitator family transporter